MDINQELARIFASAIPKATEQKKATMHEWEAHAVIQHEKYHDEYAAYREDELRLAVSALETARITMQQVYILARRHNLPILQMLMCADDCMEESINDINDRLGR